MNNNELKLIQDEFQQTNDYKTFIVKYYNVEHPDVQYMVAAANWQRIQHEYIDQKTYLNNLEFFKQKYQQHEREDIRILVLQALLSELTLTKPDLTQDEFSTSCNNLIEYAGLLDHQHPRVKDALTYAYWHKAELLKHKDVFKAYYFYKKLLNTLAKQRLESHMQQYLIARIASFQFEVKTSKHHKSIDVEFYEILDLCTEYLYLEIKTELIELIMFYVTHEVQPEKLNYDEDQVLFFERYLNKNSTIKNLITNFVYDRLDETFLLQIAYLFWNSEKIESSEVFLVSYFHRMPSAVDTTEKIQTHYYFDSLERQQDFIEFVQTSYNKFRDMQKYRQLFAKK